MKMMSPRTHLMLAAAGAVLASVFITAPPAQATPAAYTRDNARTICDTLSKTPTDAGASQVFGIIHEAGYGLEDATTIVLDAISIWCPENRPVLDTFVKHYGPVTVETLVLR